MLHSQGSEASRTITASGSLTNVLTLTTFDLDEYAFEGLRAGASGRPARMEGR